MNDSALAPTKKEPSTLAQVAWGIQHFILVVNTFLLFLCLPETLYRFALWATDGFRPFLNHVSEITPLDKLSILTLGLALLASSAGLVSQMRPNKFTIAVILAFVLQSFVFWTMITFKGLVTYGEFIQHGV